MVERRQGGETGVLSVQCLEGDAVWQARDAGRWPADLADAACGAIVSHAECDHWEDLVQNPAAILVEYADGFRATVLYVDGYAASWAYAARVVSDKSTDALSECSSCCSSSSSGGGGSSSSGGGGGGSGGSSRIEACEFFLQPGGKPCPRGS
eukprot:COSAG06_NODE_13671_length_1233_cov_0.944444_2_plen_152_part_00